MPRTRRTDRARARAARLPGQRGPSNTASSRARSAARRASARGRSRCSTCRRSGATSDRSSSSNAARVASVFPTASRSRSRTSVSRWTRSENVAGSSVEAASLGSGSSSIQPPSASVAADSASSQRPSAIAARAAFVCASTPSSASAERPAAPGPACDVALHQESLDLGPADRGVSRPQMGLGVVGVVRDQRGIRHLELPLRGADQGLDRRQRGVVQQRREALADRLRAAARYVLRALAAEHHHEQHDEEHEPHGGQPEGCACRDGAPGRAGHGCRASRPSQGLLGATARRKPNAKLRVVGRAWIRLAMRASATPSSNAPPRRTLRASGVATAAASSRAP